jgi:hypothetical protein
MSPDEVSALLINAMPESSDWDYRRSFLAGLVELCERTQSGK